MKRITFLFLLIFFYQNSNAQHDSSVENLIGVQSKENFKQQPYAEWFNVNYDGYVPDQDVVEDIKRHTKGITIKAFIGTWCGDSKHEVPAFYKLLDATNFNYKNLTMIAVSRDKSTPDNLQEGLDIERVPTFIFYKKGEEIGRFVEYPRETLEKDILKIVSGKPYKHSYETN